MVELYEISSTSRSPVRTFEAPEVDRKCTWGTRELLRKGRTFELKLERRPFELRLLGRLGIVALPVRLASEPWLQQRPWLWLQPRLFPWLQPRPWLHLEPCTPL